MGVPNSAMTKLIGELKLGKFTYKTYTMIFRDGTGQNYHYQVGFRTLGKNFGFVWVGFWYACDFGERFYSSKIIFLPRNFFAVTEN